MTPSSGATAVDVVLPRLDEAQALPWVLSHLPPGYHAIVADNGSTDGSADVARAHGARVVDVPQRGFGAACHAGLLAATADVVCFMDADASLDPQQLPRVAGPVLAGDAELVLGRRRRRRRRPTTRGAWRCTDGPATRCSPASCAGAAAWRCTTSGRCVPPADSCWSTSASPTAGRGTPSRWSPWPALPGWRVAEVDVAYAPRTGRSKVTGSVRGILTALHDMREVLVRAAAR